MRQVSHEKIINWIDDHPNPDGTIGKALTYVLPTRGCKYAMAKHGGCSMCTLPMDNPLEPSTELIQTNPVNNFYFHFFKGKSWYTPIPL